MSKRFGKNRSVDCCCDYNFTCSACLRNAPVYFFTPTTMAEQIYADSKVITPPPVKKV